MLQAFALLFNEIMRHTEERQERPFRHYSLAAMKGALAVLALSACGGNEVSGERKTFTVVADDTEAGCQPFTVFAQNRFPGPDGAFGASGRVYPDPSAEKVASFAANERLTAVGYIESDAAAYPDNPEVIDGDHWILVRTDEDSVWVNDAAIRAGITEPDSTGGYSDDLGPIVTLDPECELPHP